MQKKRREREKEKKMLENEYSNVTTLMVFKRDPSPRFYVCALLYRV